MHIETGIGTPVSVQSNYTSTIQIWIQAYSEERRMRKEGDGVHSFLETIALLVSGNSPPLPFLFCSSSPLSFTPPRLLISSLCEEEKAKKRKKEMYRHSCRGTAQKQTSMNRKVDSGKVDKISKHLD